MSVSGRSEEMAAGAAGRVGEIGADYLSAEGRQLRRLLVDFASEHSGDPAVEAAVPALALWAADYDRDLAPAPDPVRAKTLRPFVEQREQVTRVDPGHPSGYYLSNGVIFQADGTNHLRSAEPIMRELGSPDRPPATIRAPRRRIRAATRRARRAANRLLGLARRRGIPVPREFMSVPMMLIIAAQLAEHAKALVAALSPRSVVVFATPNIGPRALVQAASLEGVPSVYIPHTSVLTDLVLNDLPTDYAGLRGPREVKRYTDAIGSSERIAVVGNPSIDADRMPDRDPATPLLLAPPFLEDHARDVIETVRRAVAEPVLVTPHPRADREFLQSLIPAGWSIWDRKTYEALRRGPPAIIQASSGVSLEALVLGIPTIELRLPPDRLISYSVIREPYVRIVSSAEELRAAVQECRADVDSPEARRELRDWAFEWSSPTGEEAARRGAELIQRAGAAPAPGAIWSAWAGA